MWEELENVLRSRVTESDAEVLRAAFVVLGGIAERIDPARGWYETLLCSLSRMVDWPTNSKVMDLGLVFNDFVRTRLIYNP